MEVRERDVDSIVRAIQSGVMMGDPDHVILRQSELDFTLNPEMSPGLKRNLKKRLKYFHDELNFQFSDLDEADVREEIMRLLIEQPTHASPNATRLRITGGFELTFKLNSPGPFRASMWVHPMDMPVSKVAFRQLRELDKTELPPLAQRFIPGMSPDQKTRLWVRNNGEIALIGFKVPKP